MCVVVHQYSHAWLARRLHAHNTIFHVSFFHLCEIRSQLGHSTDQERLLERQLDHAFYEITQGYEVILCKYDTSKQQASRLLCCKPYCLVECFDNCLELKKRSVSPLNWQSSVTHHRMIILASIFYLFSNFI